MSSHHEQIVALKLRHFNYLQLGLLKAVLTYTPWQSDKWPTPNPYGENQRMQAPLATECSRVAEFAISFEHLRGC